MLKHDLSTVGTCEEESHHVNSCPLGPPICVFNIGVPKRVWPPLLRHPGIVTKLGSRGS